MTHNHEEALKQAGDLGATISTALVLISHWAEIATPIVTLLIALLTLGWWVMRYVEKLRTGKDIEA